MNKITTKADRYNELYGKEIESKIKILSKQSIDETAAYIYGELKNNKGRFVLAPSIDEVKPSTTLTRHYGYVNHQGKIKKAFTVTQRERDGLLQIKRKGPETIYYKNILCKPETIEPLIWKNWSNEAERLIKKQEAKALGFPNDADKIFIVFGDVERKKLKIRVMNSHNNRTYTIGVDQTTAPNGKFMQQIEIEYIGIESGQYSHQSSHLNNSMLTCIEKEIADEIKHIEQQIIDICHHGEIKLKLTQKTKFKWLRKMHILNLLKQSQVTNKSIGTNTTFRVFF